MRTDLQYDLCPGCGERAPVGLMAAIEHACPLNTITYYCTAKFSIRQLRDLLAGVDTLYRFRELLRFGHFRAMPNFETASEIDKIIYRVCRESDIRSMKRLRAYIELEEKFNASY